MKKVTFQESRVLELIGQGYSSQQIARALEISTNTVETHRKSLLLKLAAKNAAELVRKAIQARLINVDSSESPSNDNNYETER